MWSKILFICAVGAQHVLSQPALFQQSSSRHQELLQQQQQQQQNQQQQQQHEQQQVQQHQGQTNSRYPQQNNYQGLSEQQQRILQQQQQQYMQQLQEQRKKQQQLEQQRLQEQLRIQEQERLKQQQQRRRQQLQQQQRQEILQQQQQQQRPPVNDNFGADPGCKDPWTTEWTRDPSDCTMVHFCIQGKQQWTINCNESRIWSNIGHACVEPMSQWDDCNQVMTTPALNDPRCANEPNGMNPDPENCAQFVACVNMTVVATMECPTNTLFSTRNNTCELSHVVAAECRERSIPDHVVVTTAAPVVDKPCEGTSNGDVEDPTHCARFYKCNHGRVVARIRCPSNSAFNPERRKCDWRANVECGGRPFF